MKESSNPRNIHTAKILILAGVLLLIVDLIALFLISEKTRGPVLAILGLMMILAPILLLIGIVMLIIAKIRTKRVPKVAQKEKPISAYLVLVSERATGKIIDRAEIEETTPGNRLVEELGILTDLVKKQMEAKYPSDKYEVLTEIPKNVEESVKQYANTFRMEASSRSLFFTNLGGIIVGAVLLFLLLLLRHLYMFILFVIGVIIIVIYMTVDYIIWQKRGIRVIEIDEKGINLYRSKEKRLTKIEAGHITDINFFSKLNRRVVTILTGGTATKIMPGVTTFPGPRIRITDDSFNDKEFTVFMEKLKQFKRNSKTSSD